MSDTEVRQYSLARAIMAAADRDWSKAGLEKAASDAVAAQRKAPAQGFYVPNDVLTKQGAAGERRDLLAGTPSAGGYTIQTDLLAGSFIEVLRNRLTLQQAGATFLAGLQGNVAIPRQTGGASAFWVGENVALTASQQAFDQVTMTPKTVGGVVQMSRKMLSQSSLDVEAMVRNDITQILALEIDRAGFHGSGASNQPLGIVGQSGVGVVALGTNGAVPTWANIVALETAIAQSNADVGRIAYITNAKVRGKLKGTPKVAGTNDTMIWQGNDTPLNGYAAYVTNQIRSDATKGSGTNLSYILHGNFQDAFVGLWSGLDIMVDPYAGALTGALRVVSMQDCDVAVRHPESFSFIPDAITV